MLTVACPTCGFPISKHTEEHAQQCYRMWQARLAWHESERARLHADELARPSVNWRTYEGTRVYR